MIVCHTFGQKPQHGFVQQILGCTEIEYVLINWMNEKTADILNENIAKCIRFFIYTPKEYRNDIHSTSCNGI